MNKYYFFLFIYLGTFSIFSQENHFSSHLGINSVFEIKTNKRKSKNLFLYSFKYKNLYNFIEKRQNKLLYSINYNGKYFYFANGYRYKPSYAFNLFRDREFYSSKKENFQPLQKTRFIGLNYWNLQTGFFSLNQFKNLSEGIYFSLNQGSFFYGYIEKKKEVFASLYKDFKFRLDNTIFYSKAISEYIKNNEKMYQYYYLSFYTNYSVMGEVSQIKDRRWNILNRLNREEYFQNSKKISFQLRNYNKISLYQFENQEEKNTILESKFELFSVKKRGKIYIQGLDHTLERDFKKKSVFGLGLGYEYIMKNFLFSIGPYKRDNQDIVYEIKFFYKLKQNYVEFLLLNQSKNNEMKAYFEGDLYNNYLPGYLTDSPFLVKCKLYHQFFNFIFSQTKLKNGKNNLKFNLEANMTLE